MKPWLLACAIALALLTSSAAAAPAFSSQRLAIVGNTTLDGPATALFLVAGDRGFSWDADAPQATLKESVKPYTTAGPQAKELYTNVGDTRTKTTPLHDVTLKSTTSEDWGALLVRVTTASIHMAAGGPVDVRAVADPHLDQDQAPVSSSDTSDHYEAIHGSFAGDYLSVESRGEATYELRGDFEIVLFGPDYDLAAKEGDAKRWTGWGRTDDKVVASSGEIRQETLTLTDAVLHLHAPAGSTLLSSAPTVSFVGTLRAVDPRGDFPLALPSDGSSWSGSGSLDLAPSAGRIALEPPAALTTAGTSSAARTPPVVAGVGVAIAAAALAPLVVALVRRRASPPEDPLDLAILAMEDRRYADALPHIERALAAAPTDTRLLVDHATCLEEVGRLNEARDAYESALREEPFNAEAHYYYARTLARLRNPTGALAHLGRALGLDARLRELAGREQAFASFRDHPQFARLLS